MDEDLLGFVASGGWRRRVVQSLASRGPQAADELSSREHIPGKAVEDFLDEAEEKGIVEGNEEGYALTDKGERLAGEIGNL